MSNNFHLSIYFIAFLAKNTGKISQDFKNLRNPEIQLQVKEQFLLILMAYICTIKILYLHGTF
jgi:hypothetical protein